MKPSTVYRKTAAGEDAIQGRRISQRNLRSVLIMINGEASVADIAERFGDPQVVEGLVEELEHRGLVEPLGVDHEGSLDGRHAAELDVDFDESGSAQADDSEFNVLMSDVAVDGTLGVPTLPPDAAQGRPASGVGDFSVPIPDHHRNGRASPQPGRSERKEKAWAVEWPRIVWPRITLGTIVLVLLAGLLAVVAYLWMRSYEAERVQMQQALSEWSGQEVQVAGLGLEFSPYPALVARRIVIGAPERGSIEAVRMIPSLSTVFGKAVDFYRLDAVRPRISSRLLEALVHAQQRGDRPWGRLPVHVEDASVTVAGMDIPGWDGEVRSLGPRGGTLVSLRHQARRTLEFRSRDGAWDVQGTVFDWKPGEASSFAFDLLEFAGTLDGASLKLAKLDGRLSDAPIAGAASVDTETGAINAHMTLTRIAARRLKSGVGFPLLTEGDVSAEFDYRGNVRTLFTPGKDLAVSGKLDARQGALALDLVQAIQAGVTRPIRGGSTRFDRLTGQFVYDGASATLRVDGIDLDSGPVSAQGYVASRHGETLEGLFGVAMRSSATAVRSAVNVGGTLADPVLTPGALHRSGE